MSEGSIRAASEVGAEKDPRASLHLKLAEEQLALAKKLIESGENARADIVLQRALADSELALVLTNEATAAAQAAAVQKEVQGLRSGG